jgi:hypothetical protein
MQLPMRTCSRVTASSVVGADFLSPVALGWQAEFECLEGVNAFRRRGAVAREVLRLRVRFGSRAVEVRSEICRDGALQFAP